MTHPDEPTEWNSLIELLSLDRVIPFYGDMGLNLPDKGGFVELIRSLVVEGHQKFGPGRTPDMEFVRYVFDRFRRFLGTESFEAFYKWAMTVFCWAPSDQAQWSIWDDIIPRTPGHMPPGLPVEKWNAVARFQQAEETGDVEARVIAQKRNPLTEWDAMMYARYNYRDKTDRDDVFEEGVDPLAPILSTIQINRMQLAWAAFWNSFSDDEKDILWKYAQNKFDEWELIDAIPGGLMHPDSLYRQL
jgi:hypothetical protein